MLVALCKRSEAARKTFREQGFSILPHEDAFEYFEILLETGESIEDLCLHFMRNKISEQKKSAVAFMRFFSKKAPKTQAFYLLFYAVTKDNHPIIEAFLENNPTLLNREIAAEEVEKYGIYCPRRFYTAFAIALNEGKPSTAKFLISKGAMLYPQDIWIVAQRAKEHREQIIPLLKKVTKGSDFLGVLNEGLLQKFDSNENFDEIFCECLLAVGAKIYNGAQKALAEKVLNIHKMSFLLENVFQDEALKIKALERITKNWKRHFFEKEMKKVGWEIEQENKWICRALLKDIPADKHFDENAVLLYAALKNSPCANNLIGKGYPLCYDKHKRKSITIESHVEDDVQKAIHDFIHTYENKLALIICFLNYYIETIRTALNNGQRKDHLFWKIESPGGVDKTDKFPVAKDFLKYVKACLSPDILAEWKITRHEFEILNNSDLGDIYAFFKKHCPEHVAGIQIEDLLPASTAGVQPNVSTSSPGPGS